MKTLTDRDANRVDFTPRRTTIRELGRLTPPSKRPYDRRAGVAERQLFCIEAWIVEPPRPQEDGDLHVALQQVGDTTARMLVEIPDVRCATVCSSPYAAAFAQARLTMERALKSWKGDSLRVRVVGVGFFDRNHGQFGAARNFFELHPVLAVSFP